MTPGEEQKEMATVSAADAEIDWSFFVTQKPPPKRVWKFLDHFNVKDLKLLFKCSLAAWVMTIFIFIDQTLDVIGQAAFFGCIVLFILPPSGVVFINILGGITMCFGIALGWAWGVITMKAALATRPQADVSVRYTELQRSAPQNTTNAGQASGQTAYAQIAIFNGFMLDTRVTVTYFCMTGLFIYLMARLRVAAPKLTLVSMFAMVVSDIYLTMAPLIPTFVGTMPKTIILPAAIAIGVSTACNVLIFPQSTSSIVLNGMVEVLSEMVPFVNALNWHLKNPETPFNVKRLENLKAEIAKMYKGLEGPAKFLPLDFSYSKWNADDIESLQVPLRKTVIAFDELLQLPISRERRKAKGDALLKVAEDLHGPSNGSLPVAYHQIARAVDFGSNSLRPDTEIMVNKTLMALSKCADPLLQAWLHSFASTYKVMSGHAQGGSESIAQEHQMVFKRLKDAYEEFEKEAAYHIFETQSQLFDLDGNIISPNSSDTKAPLVALLFGLLFQQRINDLYVASSELLQEMVWIDQRRQKRRLWLPRGLRNFIPWAMSKDVPNSPQSPKDKINQKGASIPLEPIQGVGRGGQRKWPPGAANDRTAAARLKQMQEPHARQRSKVSTLFLSIINWITNQEGIFALRVLVLSITFAVPAVVPSSAGFYYREKGMWALMMGQLAISPYASDFVSGLIVRTFCTIAGGVIGMVCWYMGAGLGSGNPYALSAIMAVVITCLMWWRLFGPAEQMMTCVMLVATLYMVVSYSWIDTQIPSYGNPGVGYAVFWRRVLLVIIGFAGATVVTFFPRPTSGSRHCREVLSEQLQTIKSRYSLFVSTWHWAPDDLLEVSETEWVRSDEALTALVQTIQKSQFEFSTSNINSDTLQQVCTLCTDLNNQITQLLTCVNQMPFQTRTRFVRHTGVISERFVVALMAVLTLVQRSLQSGAPLPAVLPTPLITKSSLFNSKPNQDLGKESPQDEQQSFRDLLTKGEGPQLVSAINAFSIILASIDDLVIVVKKAVGEESFVDPGSLDLEASLNEHRDE